jgi:DNA repair protein RecN (Recombination protein N)
MLTTLSIKNLALIQNIEIKLSDGFSVFTGETGAGKSVLMGAIGLLLGNRAASEHIRSGEEKAEVSGEFQFETVPLAVTQLCADNEIEIDDGTVIIRRIIAKNGRNKIIINGVQTPLVTLKQMGDALIDLHGQHDHQTLLQEESAISIIDSLKGVYPIKKSYRDSYSAFSAAKRAVTEQKKRAVALAEKQEFMQFQFDEMSSLALKEGEEAELESEYRLLSSITERALGAGTVLNLIEGSSSSPSLVHTISQLTEQLTELSRNDESYKEWRDEVKGAGRLFDDLGSTVSSYVRQIQEEANPRRLDDINSRLSKIQRLKKKYLTDYEGVIKKRDELEKELDDIFNSDADATYLEKKLLDAEVLLFASGERLTEVRKKQAQKFDAEITFEMALLGFSGGAFSTDFIAQEHPTENGTTLPLFLVKANRGEQFMALSKTASGGEISRIMLAIKATLAENDPVPILVFDEIDTGVGGTIAADIATAMEKLAVHHQIFVISHLHQIASRAKHHYSVYKTEENGRTITLINQLSGDERVLEVARMLGGEGDAEIGHARKLLSL